MELENIDEVAKLIDVNVLGIYRATLSFIKMIRESKGRIISTGSVAGIIAQAGSSAYSASKFALEGMMDSMRLEMDPFGVSVSIIEPAYVKSRIAGKQVGENTPIRKSPASAEVKELYEDFLETQDSKRIKAEKMATDTKTMSKAIMRALTDPKPKTRYVVAYFYYIPAFLLTLMYWLLSDRVEDALITYISKMP